MHHSVDKRKSKLTEASNIIINCVFSYVFGPKTRNLHCFYIFFKKKEEKKFKLECRQLGHVSMLARLAKLDVLQPLPPLDHQSHRPQG